MKVELFKRRALYVLSAAAWLGVVPLVMDALDTESSDDRVYLMVGLTVAMTLTVVSGIVMMALPLKEVFRCGYDAGQRSTGCSMFRPTLTVVDSEATVTSIVRRH